MSLGENIRRYRLERGFSQDYIAKELGYKSFTTIQKWESDISQPPMKTLAELAALLEVDVYALMGKTRPDYVMYLEDDSPVVFENITGYCREPEAKYVAPYDRNMKLNAVADCLSKEDFDKLYEYAVMLKKVGDIEKKPQK